MIAQTQQVLRLLNRYDYNTLAGLAGVARQGPSISNVRIKYFGSTGQAGFTHPALV